MSIDVLTKSDIRRLTGCCKLDDQKAELNHLMIDWQVRSDGSLLVFESDVFAHHRNGKKSVELNLDQL